jgi:hypothetical protein
MVERWSNSSLRRWRHETKFKDGVKFQIIAHCIDELSIADGEYKLSAFIRTTLYLSFDAGQYVASRSKTGIGAKRLGPASELLDSNHAIRFFKYGYNQRYKIFFPYNVLPLLPTKSSKDPVGSVRLCADGRSV